VLQGNTAYVSWNTFLNESGGLSIFSLNDPTQPEWVSTYNAAGEGFLAVDADATFAYAGNDRLRLLKITDPPNPAEVGHYNTPGYAQDLLVSRGNIYLADGDGGLFIFKPAITIYTVSGQVLDPTGNLLAGVTVSADPGLSDIVDRDGNFTISGLDAGTYLLAPGLSGYAFYPAQCSVTVPPDQAGQDFTILAQPVSTSPVPGTSASLAYSDTQGGTHATGFCLRRSYPGDNGDVDPDPGSGSGRSGLHGQRLRTGRCSIRNLVTRLYVQLPGNRHPAILGRRAAPGRRRGPAGAIRLDGSRLDGCRPNLRPDLPGDPLQRSQYPDRPDLPGWQIRLVRPNRTGIPSLR
jgi:hypothetical protein